VGILLNISQYAGNRSVDLELLQSLVARARKDPEGLQTAPVRRIAQPEVGPSFFE
jgi:hypothetical protein